MKVFILCVLVLFIYDCGAPPVNEKKKGKDKEHAETNDIDQQVFDVEYKRYLQEVVNVLESDADFKDRLVKADPEDIKSGKISKELEFVNHNVRSKLDELKRQELERLRHLAIQQYEQSNGIDKKHMKIPAHIDPKNPHTFEAEDLRKLIVQTTKELEDADRQRKEEFKEYEMQKELLYEEQLKHLDEKQRAEAEAEHKKLQEKHKEHKPLHHPGSKPQLEQVWEEQDHMSPEDFNPKTFFHLHDLDGNGVWDANEVKALFKKELDKMYDPNAPEDDIRERFEEMERMREHVFNETDTNRDQLVSYQEFLEQTKKQEFERDEGWDPVDQQGTYNQDEYREYAKQHEEEIRRLIDQGVAMPGMPPNGIPPQYLHPGQGYPPQGMHGQGYPPGGHGQGYPPQGAHGQGYPPQGAHGQGYPPQGQHGAYPPQQHAVPPHLDHQNQYQNAPPVQHHQQQQYHPNEIPQHHGQAPPVQYQPPHHQQQQYQNQHHEANVQHHEANLQHQQQQQYQNQQHHEAANLQHQQQQIPNIQHQQTPIPPGNAVHHDQPAADSHHQNQNNVPQTHESQPSISHAGSDHNSVNTNSNAPPQQGHAAGAVVPPPSS